MCKYRTYNVLCSCVFWLQSSIRWQMTIRDLECRARLSNLSIQYSLVVCSQKTEDIATEDVSHCLLNQYYCWFTLKFAMCEHQIWMRFANLHAWEMTMIKWALQVMFDVDIIIVFSVIIEIDQGTWWPNRDGQHRPMSIFYTNAHDSAHDQ